MIDISDLIGTPFNDMHCWELTEEVFSRCGITMPTYDIGADETKKISLQYANGMSEADAGVGPWEKLDKPEVPCLVAIKTHPKYVSHCGVYIGNHQFIHSLSDTGVIISKLKDPRWSKKIVGFYRYR